MSNDELLSSEKDKRPHSKINAFDTPQCSSKPNNVIKRVLIWIEIAMMEK